MPLYAVTRRPGAGWRSERTSIGLETLPVDRCQLWSLGLGTL